MTHNHGSLIINCITDDSVHAPIADQLLCSAGVGATPHLHIIFIGSTDQHLHGFTISVDDAELGDDWTTHTHPCSLIVEGNGGTNHNHVVSSPTLGRGCRYPGTWLCDAIANQHWHTVLLTSGLYNNVHNDHPLASITCSVPNTGGTPQNHTHTISISGIGSGGSHGHTTSGYISFKVCYGGKNHSHYNSGGLPAIGHTHAGNVGISNFGGEGVVPFGDGLIWIT